MNTDKNGIEELLTRGVEKIYPTKEFLKTKIEKGEKITLYLGIDPTGPTLHLGHAIILKKLRDFHFSLNCDTSSGVPALMDLTYTTFTVPSPTP